MKNTRIEGIRNKQKDKEKKKSRDEEYNYRVSHTPTYKEKSDNKESLDD